MYYFTEMLIDNNNIIVVISHYAFIKYFSYVNTKLLVHNNNWHLIGFLLNNNIITCCGRQSENRVCNNTHGLYHISNSYYHNVY